MSNYPLGVMYANGAIDAHQHMAGLYYAWLHAIVRPSRRIMTAAQRFERLPRAHERNSEDPEYVAWRRRQKQQYELGRQAVAEVGLRGAEFVNSTILYEEMPRFLQPKHRTFTDIWESQVVNQALTNLVKCYQQIKRDPFDKSAKRA